MSGVRGVDSPGTAVVGRKREAMTTRWFLRLAIVQDKEAGWVSMMNGIYRRHGRCLIRLSGPIDHILPFRDVLPAFSAIHRRRNLQ